jgi:hypothetical protein
MTGLSLAEINCWTYNKEMIHPFCPAEEMSGVASASDSA